MSWRAWQFLVVCVVTSFAAAAASMIYANRVAAESERQWCGVIVTLDDAYRRQQPRSDAARQLADDIARLRTSFDCPPRQ